jgi:hypothetical protein
MIEEILRLIEKLSEGAKPNGARWQNQCPIYGDST